MVGHVCSIVPPHLLEAVANSEDPEARQLGAKTLAISRLVHKTRREHIASKLSQNPFGNNGPSGSPQQGIVPNILLEHISKADDIDESVKKSAAESLAVSQQIRDGRQAPLKTKTQAAGADTTVQFHRGVYDLQHQGDENNLGDLLPGKPVRLEGQPPAKDKAVNEAYDNSLKVLEFYRKFFNYTSLDNKNMPVTSTVHFSQNYGNAFWTDEYQQMLYGDGDKLLHNFTGCIDVIGHEMTVRSLFPFILPSKPPFIPVTTLMGTLVTEMGTPSADYHSHSTP